MDYLGSYVKATEKILVFIGKFSLEIPKVSLLREHLDWDMLTDEIQWSSFREGNITYFNERSLKLSLVWYTQNKDRKWCSFVISVSSEEDHIFTYEEFATPKLKYDKLTVSLLRNLSYTRSYEDARLCKDLKAIFLSKYNHKTISSFASLLSEKISYFTSDRWVSQKTEDGYALLDVRGFKALLNILSLEEQTSKCFGTLLNSLSENKDTLIVVPHSFESYHIQLSYTGQKISSCYNTIDGAHSPDTIKRLHYQFPLFDYNTGCLGELFYDVHEENGVLCVEFIVSSESCLPHHSV